MVDFANRTEAARLYLDGKLRSVDEGYGLRINGDSDTIVVRAMSGHEATKGEKIVPQGFFDTIYAARDTTSVVRSVSTVFQTESAGPLRIPTANDTANIAGQFAENAERTSTDDVVIGAATFDNYSFTSRLIVSREYTHDSGFGAQGQLGKLLGDRIGQATDAKFTTGSGSGEPLGIVTGATVGLTAVDDTTVTYAELVNILAALDDAYHANAKWMMRRSTLAGIAKILDGAQRPIFDLTNGTLFGKPIIVNRHCPAMAADAKAILLGDFAAGFAIRERDTLTITRNEQARADHYQVIISANAQVDSRYLNSGAIVCLRMGGS